MCDALHMSTQQNVHIYDHDDLMWCTSMLTYMTLYCIVVHCKDTSGWGKKG